MKSISVTAALLLLLAWANASASGLYDAVGRLRSGDGPCAGAARQAESPPPLVPQSALEQIAMALSQGRSFADSAKTSGYRAARWYYINVSGTRSEQQTIAKLGRQFCAQLRDSTYSEIGIYQGSQQTWIVLAAPFAPPANEPEQRAAHEILVLVNRARAQARLCGNELFRAVAPLRWNELLARASREHARDMAHYNYFSHRGRDGSTPPERVTRDGYRYRKIAENIASGQSTPEEAVIGWLNSPEHCSNLMDPAFSDMGAAFSVNAASDAGVYWVQVFGRSG